MSIDPLRNAARALAVWERRQEIASHNIANTETPGYKRQRVFAELLDGVGPVASVRDDMTAGVVRDTGRPLDLAVTGEGFLVVEAEGGELLRRGGSLSLDAAGVLVDAGGRPVLGEEGLVVLPPGQVEIDATGLVRVDGAEVARLRMERAAPEALERVEAGLWRAAVSEAVPDGERTLRQGGLEDSNFDPLRGMVEMMEIQRGHAAVQKTITALDGVLDTAVNRIGRVG